MRHPVQSHDSGGPVRRAWLVVSSLLGLVAVVFGIAAITAPEAAAMIYGLGPPRDPVWVMAAGVRDLGLGVALLVAVGLRSDTGVGAILLGLAIIGLGDAVLLWTITGGPVAAHLLHFSGCAVSLLIAFVGAGIRASEGRM